MHIFFSFQQLMLLNEETDTDSLKHIDAASEQFNKEGSFLFEKKESLAKWLLDGGRIATSI